MPLGSSEISWNPEGTKGLVYLYDGYASETLYQISKDGYEALDVTITDGDKSWNLSNLYPDFQDSKIPLSGNAGRADWSPNGELIAFFASSAAIGQTDIKRVYAENKLYVMNTDTMKPISVLDNIHFPFFIKWSPDSRHIAFIGQYGDSKKDGIWLYSIDTKTVELVETGRFQDVLWGQNDTDNHLYTIRCDDNFNCNEIFEYDLSSFLN